MSDEEDTTNLLSERETGRKCMNTVRPVTRIKINQLPSNVVPVSQSQIILTSSVAVLGGIALGYDIGVTASFLCLAKDYFKFTYYEHDVTIYSWFFGAILAAIFGGSIIDNCGRRWTLCHSSCLMLVGSFILVLANSFPLFLCARTVSGFAGALSAVTQCVYAAEVSSQATRGRSVSLHQLGVVMGTLLCFVCAVGAQSTNWKILATLSSIPALLQLALSIFCLPQSPHFAWLQATKAARMKKITFCSSTNIWETLVLALGLVFYQNFSGKPTVLYYAPRLFMLLGVCPDLASTVTNITSSIVQVFFTSLSLCLIDRVGRRPALIVGITCMMTSVALLGVFSSMEDNGQVVTSISQAASCDSANIWVSFNQEMGLLYSSGNGVASPVLATGAPPFPLLPTPVSLVAKDPWVDAVPNCLQNVHSSLSVSVRYLTLATYVIFLAAYSFSLGPIVWLLIVELFPAMTRGRAVCLTTCLYWAAELINQLSLPSLTGNFTVGGTFLLHSIICLVGILFIFLFLPETKGKTLHQVAQELKNRSPKTRMFQNLHGLPCLNKNEWLLHKSRQYRQVVHSGMENTVI